jgi:uracil-DNA glycosylase
MSPEDARSLRLTTRQQLDSLRRAGVKQILRKPRKSAPPVADHVGQSADGPRGTEPSACGASSAPLAAAAEARASSLFEGKRSTMGRAEREERLRALAARVAGCTRCAELAETRTQTVFGVGNPQAKIMFVGEAPGADEDKQGEPFVGAAGQLLNRILEASRLARSDVYICNILRCRPPGNRLPRPEEAANCREYLEGTIETVDPDYIVCLGSCAATNLLGAKDSIGKLRGRFLRYGRAKVLCTYHPAYLLRNPAAKKDVWEDMKILLRELGVEP